MFAVHAHKLDMHVQNLTASRNFHSSTCYFQKLLVVRLFVGKLNVRLFFTSSVENVKPVGSRKSWSSFGLVCSLSKSLDICQVCSVVLPVDH